MYMEKAMEYILKVHECKSISKAAEQLFISQPALSNIIKKKKISTGLYCLIEILNLSS
ncbi:helix-turn-helix domain-containing protein [Acidaminococcus intestini]|uniref:helix-turn-helix domain-containing protein n=1 Tax=Acidaminococcus intestini TaxID=187327 RepID=UPI003C6CD1D5